MERSDIEGSTEEEQPDEWNATGARYAPGTREYGRALVVSLDETPTRCAPDSFGGGDIHSTMNHLGVHALQDCHWVAHIRYFLETKPGEKGGEYAIII